MTHRSVRLHRVLRCPPERAFRAFTDPAAMVKWLPPEGFTGRVHHLDARVGGTWRMAFTNFSSGGEHAFGGEYLEVMPGVRLRYTSVFDAPGLPGTMTTTVAFEAVGCGTALTVVQQGIPDPIPLDGCHLGWQESLAQLARLVEPEVPG